MQCHWVLERLTPYLDDELSPADTVSVSTHLQVCNSCRAQHTQFLEINEMIGESGRHPLPQNMQQKLLHRLDQENARSGLKMASLRRYLSPVYGLAAGLILGVIGHSVYDNQMARQASLTDWLVSAHIDSQLADHFLDVVSTDEHTVKPWFNGRINYAVPVKNLGGEGFDLLGGRIDYTGDQTVAALGYSYRKHFINLYIWPEQAALPDVLHQAKHRGYNLIGWESGGLWYIAISDLNPVELARLKVLYKN